MIETRVGLQAALNGDRTKAEDAELLAASGLVDRLTRILVEPGEIQLLNSEDKASGAIGLVEDIHDALDRYGLTAPRLQHGDGHVTWTLLADAVRRDLDTRIGLEDTLHEPDGERTSGNEALVRAARELGAHGDYSARRSKS
jgi:Arc/MetJ family transcription regulator